MRITGTLNQGYWGRGAIADDRVKGLSPVRPVASHTGAAALAAPIRVRVRLSLEDDRRRAMGLRGPLHPLA